MKVTIDAERCQGHGRCYEVAPDVFTDDERGRGEVISAEVPVHLEDQVRSAVSACPEKAISIS
ncbi:MAG TPA: ferredoxin [Actinobacteria bacterium]|nr:ferredoxin [Actinomycetota bacterium]